MHTLCTELSTVVCNFGSRTLLERLIRGFCLSTPVELHVCKFSPLLISAVDNLQRRQRNEGRAEECQGDQQKR